MELVLNSKKLLLPALLVAGGVGSFGIWTSLTNAQDGMGGGEEAGTVVAQPAMGEGAQPGSAEPWKDAGFESQSAWWSYAIGLDIGGSFKTQDISIDPDVMADALKAAYAGDEAKLTKEQAAEAVQDFQMQMQMKMMQQQMQMQQEQGAKNTEASKEFFAENTAKEGVQTTDSGLQYQITEKGEGDKPAPTDTVTVHYKGTLLDGTVFDSSYDRGEPVSFPLDGVIAGFSEGLQLMPVGSKGVLFIPGELAYGQQGGPGGPGAALIFEVELLSAEKTPAQPAQDGNAPELPALGD